MYYNKGTVRNHVENSFITLLNECEKAVGEECGVRITGGSECWLHASHGPSTYSFDISDDNNPQMNRFLNGVLAGTDTSNNQTFTARDNMKKDINKFGISALWAEGSGGTHWHIEFQQP